MRKKIQKTRCEKRSISKCEGVLRTYDKVQNAYANVLEERKDIVNIRCNVVLSILDGAYTSDFVCEKENGELLVRECTFKKFLSKPMTIKLLDESRKYWLEHGVMDWGIVVEEGDVEL